MSSQLTKWLLSFKIKQRRILWVKKDLQLEIVCHSQLSSSTTTKFSLGRDEK